MKKEWLWGPGRIDPEYKGLAKREYLERLAAVRESYLAKLLQNLRAEDIQYICRLEKDRFSLLAELDQVSEEEFKKPEEGGEWSLADVAAHLLTHEEKNVDPEVNETLQHMAEHEETHLRQAQRIVSGLRRTDGARAGG